MTHAELIAEIVLLAEDRGLPWHYCKDSRHCDGTKGFPDLVILGLWHALFREVKTDTGRRTQEQVKYGNRLGLAGQDYAVWRERDLHSGRIRRELDVIVDSDLIVKPGT